MSKTLENANTTSDILLKLQNDLLDEMNYRKQMEEKATDLMCDGKYEEAIEVLKLIDNSKVLGIADEIEKLKGEQWNR